MELLAGASPGPAQRILEGVLDRLRLASVQADCDFVSAGLLVQAARHRGLRIRSIVDCLIANVALRAGLPVAHRDADYAAIATVAPLEVIDLR